jgi:hypothetical protein
MAIAVVDHPFDTKWWVWTAATALTLLAGHPAGGQDVRPPGFVDAAAVVPGLVVEMHYFGSNNFIGRPVDGYERPIWLLLFATPTDRARLRRTCFKQQKPQLPGGWGFRATRGRRHGMLRQMRNIMRASRAGSRKSARAFRCIGSTLSLSSSA